jgi:uncharacterized protein YbcI
MDERPSYGRLVTAISNAVVRLFSEFTGKGPTRARTLIDRDVITVVLADMLTKAERTLVETGQAEVVLSMRQQFQRSMRAELVAVVERLTQRKVIAFMSDNHIDPDMAAEVFVLEAEARKPTEAEASDSST